MLQFCLCNTSSGSGSLFSLKFLFDNTGQGWYLSMTHICEGLSVFICSHMFHRIDLNDLRSNNQLSRRSAYDHMMFYCILTHSWPTSIALKMLSRLHLSHHTGSSWRINSSFVGLIKFTHDSPIFDITPSLRLIPNLKHCI